jgi:hypothetical protein
MRIADYSHARRVLSGCSAPAFHVELDQTGTPHERAKVRRLLGRLRRAVTKTTEERICTAAEKVLIDLWQERTGKRQPSRRQVAFTVTAFSTSQEKDAHLELAHMLPHWQIAGQERHRLLLAPEWFHELLLAIWKNPYSTWRAIASDVPEGTPVQGPGKAVEITDAGEIEGLRSLWEEDPLSPFHQPATVLEAVRLL